MQRQAYPPRESLWRKLVGLQRVQDGSTPGCALGMAQAVMAWSWGADIDQFWPLHIWADGPQGPGCSLRKTWMVVGAGQSGWAAGRGACPAKLLIQSRYRSRWKCDCRGYGIVMETEQGKGSGLTCMFLVGRLAALHSCRPRPALTVCMGSGLWASENSLSYLCMAFCYKVHKSAILPPGLHCIDVMLGYIRSRLVARSTPTTRCEKLCQSLQAF